MEKRETAPTRDADPRIERTRSKVIDVAAALLREEGPEALTHARVAERAGIGRATVYRHWPNRDGLVLEALESVTLSITAPQGLSLDESLIAMLVALRDRLESPVGLAFGSLVERAARDPRARRALDAIVANAAQELRSVLERALREEEPVPDLPLEAILADLAGPCFIERYVMGRSSSRAEIAFRVRGLLARWRSRP
jgi:AcrR family transcriptional regulator